MTHVDLHKISMGFSLSSVFCLGLVKFAKASRKQWDLRWPNLFVIVFVDFEFEMFPEFFLWSFNGFWYFAFNVDVIVS